jgi:hypothetical protein
MAFAAGAGIHQSQSGSVFQAQNGPGINAQGYISSGTQTYGAGLGAADINATKTTVKLPFNLGTVKNIDIDGSAVIGIAGGTQGAVMSGSQLGIGHSQNQFGTYNNTQGASVYAY